MDFLMLAFSRAKKTYPFMKREIKKPFFNHGILFFIFEIFMKGNLTNA